MQQEKEERLKYVRENKIENRLVVENEVLQWGKQILENSVSEVTKGKYRDNDREKHMQHKYGEQWELIDAQARNVFTSFTPSMIKWISVINHYRNMIRKIDKSNVTVLLPVRRENERLIIRTYETC